MMQRGEIADLAGEDPASRGLRSLGGDAHLLEDGQLLAQLLEVVLPEAEARSAASSLISRLGSIPNVVFAAPAELASPPTSAAAIRLLAAVRAISERCLQRKAEGVSVLSDPRQLIDFWRFRIGRLRREVFEVGYLDSAYQFLPDGVERIEDGTVNRAAVYPRSVVTAALRREAFGIVLAHNHPTPSPVRTWITNAPSWVQGSPLRGNSSVRAPRDFDLGERAAIALADALSADLLLIDDARGRPEARRRHLTVTGTLVSRHRCTQRR